MIILAFDPGHSTGIAAIQNGEMILQATVSSPIILNTTYVHNLVGLLAPDIMVVEDLPSRSVDPLTAEVYGRIYQTCTLATFHNSRLVKVIAPGLWKPVIKRTLPRAKDKAFVFHARDALGLARYMDLIKEVK